VNVARRAHVYPQVSLEAADLADVAVATAPGSITAADALALVRKRDAGLLAAGPAYVLRDDLVRAVALGLGGRRAAELARPLPAVDPRSSEIAVRRLLAAGAPLAVVRGAKGPVGAISGRFAGLGQRGWALYSLATGVVFLAVWLACSSGPSRTWSTWPTRRRRCTASDGFRWWRHNCGQASRPRRVERSIVSPGSCWARSPWPDQGCSMAIPPSSDCVQDAARSSRTHYEVLPTAIPDRAGLFIALTR